MELKTTILFLISSIPFGYFELVSETTNDFIDLVKQPYYVDKSYLVLEFLHHRNEQNFITYPRQFGKTVNIKMLKTFFQAEVNSSGHIKPYNQTNAYEIFKPSKLFQNHPDVIRDHMAQYPVLCFDFKLNITKETTRQQVVRILNERISQSFSEYEWMRNVELDDVSECSTVPELSHVFSVDQNLINHFSESKLVPELIPEAPTELCHVTYSEYGVVQPGSVLTDEQSFVQPSITWDADPNSLYTLYWAGIASQRLVATRSPDYEDMTYEDRIKTEYSIMVVVNIPGNNYSAGLDLWSYVPPGDPPVKKLRDRYAILIYKQQDTIVPPTKKYDEYEFQTFTPLVKFVKRYNLIGPVAGNMFYTQKDDNERI